MTAPTTDVSAVLCFLNQFAVELKAPLSTSNLRQPSMLKAICFFNNHACGEQLWAWLGLCSALPSMDTIHGRWAQVLLHAES